MSLTTRFSALALAVLVATFVFAHSSRQAEALWACDAPDMVIDDQEMQLLHMINAYRASYGIGPLQLSENLNRSAGWLAGDLGYRNYFSHNDWFGRGFAQRMWDCENFAAPMGENIAAGTHAYDAASAFQMWRNSPSHNAQMLDPNYNYIGISRYFGPASTYGWYWVTDFSSW